MQYGFAIDQRTCIGCHACTVACKTEHEIPVGQFRTWVKYVEKGAFPDTTRDFGVMRCNHCTDAPCVSICPTQSLFKRDDGIVDFDRDRCIGCKACMQACPYDAIYIDEDTHTAAKCNFCAHRIDEDLEPACVVVCPTHSIWVGDVDDPDSGISKLINNNATAVRSPEKNTGPNVFYLGADRAVLDPLGAPVDESYYAARPDAQRSAMAAYMPRDPVTNARTTQNTAHPRPWGWRVTTYLWTKSIGAGALLLAAVAVLFGLDLGVLGTLVAPALAVAMTAITGVLLVWDLKQPKRFLFIFLKPNLTSWMFWGSVALAAFATVSAAWLGLGLLGQFTSFDTHPYFVALAFAAIPASLMGSGYTGFLFGQAEGRDLWQSPLLFWHLGVQALMVGSGALALAAPFVSLSETGQTFIVRTLTLAAVAHLFMLVIEYGGRHPTKQGAAAAHLITHGPYARLFWTIGVGGTTVAAVFAALGWNGGFAASAVLVAAVIVQVALLAYESVFVRAGQDLPLS